MEFPSAKVKSVHKQITEKKDTMSNQEINNKIQELSLNYFQPTYITSENLAVLVRMGFNSNSKQIWVVNQDGNKLYEITNDQQYDHSALSWNSAEEKLAFQRHLLTSSDSLPEVWIWECKNNQFQLIAKNASRAIWIP